MGAQEKIAMYQLDHYGNNVYLEKVDGGFQLKRTNTSHFHTTTEATIFIPSGEVDKICNGLGYCKLPEEEVEITEFAELLYAFREAMTIESIKANIESFLLANHYCKPLGRPDREKILQLKSMIKGITNLSSDRDKWAEMFDIIDQIALMPDMTKPPLLTVTKTKETHV